MNEWKPYFYDLSENIWYIKNVILHRKILQYYRIFTWSIHCETWFSFSSNYKVNFWNSYSELQLNYLNTKLVLAGCSILGIKTFFATKMFLYGFYWKNCIATWYWGGGGVYETWSKFVEFYRGPMGEIHPVWSFSP